MNNEATLTFKQMHEVLGDVFQYLQKESKAHQSTTLTLDAEEKTITLTASRIRITYDDSQKMLTSYLGIFDSSYPGESEHYKALIRFNDPYKALCEFLLEVLNAENAFSVVEDNQTNEVVNPTRLPELFMFQEISKTYKHVREIELLIGILVVLRTLRDFERASN